MYSQPLFLPKDPTELHRLMQAYPLATVVTAAGDAGFAAHLLPLEVVADAGAALRLRGHVARSHAMARDIAEGAAVMAVFQSPNAYISPRWYVNGQRSGRVAPSWNYAAAEACGRLAWVRGDRGWLLDHLRALTAAQEGGRAQPWSLDDAAASFIDDAAAHLVGFEIMVERLEGKRFLSQQRTEADRRSVVEHLAREASGAARDVAALIVP